MSNRIKNNLKNLVGQTLNQYYSKVKPTISDLRYKQEYQDRIIECMVGEVDDNYIETPETNEPVVKLEHSKEGLVKVPSIKGKTILVDADGNETDTPAEGCRLVSVGEDEDNKLIILSKNKNLITPQDIKELEFGWSDYISIPNDGRYVISRGSSTKTPYVRQFTRDKVKKNIDETFGTARLLDVDTGFIRIQNIKSISDLQLEKGNKATNYVEPKSHKTEILLDEPLRSLPNGVCDEIVGNKIIRRVGSQWFKDNHIEFLYELAEPIIEELPNSITLQGFDDTTMYIENSITPTVSYGYNALIPYKNELSNQKEEVEVNTLDIENNIIPYLMDMEFNLMMMEDEE